jgi:hypothetical protein
LGDYSDIDWSEADIVFLPSVSYSEKKLLNIILYGKNLRFGSKIITLRLPQISAPRVDKKSKKIEIFDNGYDGDNIDNNDSNNDNNNDNNDDNNDNDSMNINIDNDDYQKYFDFERTIWCKMSWGRMRAYLLVRNNTV